MGIGHPGLRDQFLYARRHIGNRRYMIVDNIDLSASCDLSGDRFTDGLVTVFHDKCLDGQAVLGGFLQNAHIADPGKAHVQSAGDRSRCQGQDVHILAHLLDLLFVRDAETLFLVDDQQTKLLKLHIF